MVEFYALGVEDVGIETLGVQRCGQLGEEDMVNVHLAVDDEVGGEAYYAVVSAEEYVALAWLDSRIAVELPYLISAE